jgi:hypothetical protein
MFDRIPPAQNLFGRVRVSCPPPGGALLDEPRGLSQQRKLMAYDSTLFREGAALLRIIGLPEIIRNP